MGVKVIDFIAKARQSQGKITVGAMLAEQAKAHAGKPALVFHHSQRSITFGELNAGAREVAAGLLALGAARGEQAALWAPNLPGYFGVVFGCGLAGVPLVLVNTNYRAFELEQVLRQADVATLFIADGAAREGEYLEAIREICPELAGAAPGELAAARLPSLRRVVFLGEESQPGMFSWPEFLALAAGVAAEKVAAREAAVQPDDVFLLQHTSGTTGVPKGALLPHASYIRNACAVVECQELTPADCLCVPLPFFHAYGSVMIISALAAGASVAPVEKFRARAMLEVIESCRATDMCGTPTMYIAALEEMASRPYDLSSLQGGTISGAYCPPELVKAVVEKMGARDFAVIYGMTEALCTMGRPSDPLAKRCGTVGRVMPDRELKIVDPHTGETVPTGTAGELCVRGASVIRGYYRMPEATAAVIDSEGWLHSGDLAQVDAEGYYSITGRLKDMIIRGGENIYPAEIEQFLFTHPKVADAQVVGIPCDYYGEDVVAFVRLKPGCTATSLELKRFCRERIALIKVPAKFFFVEQYPLTASGKVQKFKLRETAARLMAEDEGK
jgi:fatty-acyl-CoA synthase